MSKPAADHARRNSGYQEAAWQLSSTGPMKSGRHARNDIQAAWGVDTYIVLIYFRFMPKTNTTQYALLGLLMYQPLTGYEIKKSIDSSIAFFWQESYGHIYPMLHRLEEERLVVSSREETDGRPARKRYTITEAGQSAFRAWMSQPVEPLRFRHELLLKVFFSARPGAPSMNAILEEEEERMRQLLATYEQIRLHLTETDHGPAMKRDSVCWLLTLDLGIRFARETLAWCSEARTQLCRD